MLTPYSDLWRSPLSFLNSGFIEHHVFYWKNVENKDVLLEIIIKKFINTYYSNYLFFLKKYPANKKLQFVFYKFHKAKSKLRIRVSRYPVFNLNNKVGYEY